MSTRLAKGSNTSAMLAAAMLPLIFPLLGCRYSSVVFAPRAPEEKSVPASGQESSRDYALEIVIPDEPVVRIVSGRVTCTGTLIEEDQVLTAHHCVSRRDDGGKVLPEDVPPEEVQVELGGDYLPWGEVGVRALVTPSCGHAAGVGDIAILVLDKPLRNAPLARPRLDDKPVQGERVRPVGFGRCGLSSDGIRRRQRSGGFIDKILFDRFKLDASVCPGDSGGPAISIERDDVVGVISASVMDADAGTRGRSEFTRLDRWRPVFAAAKLVAEGAEPAELPPVDCPKLGK